MRNQTNSWRIWAVGALWLTLAGCGKKAEAPPAVDPAAAAADKAAADKAAADKAAADKAAADEAAAAPAAVTPPGLAGTATRVDAADEVIPPGVPSEAPAADEAQVRASDALALLPLDDVRRQIVLGCTPCHQIGTAVTTRQSEAEWLEVVKRMKKIDDDLDLALIPLKAEEIAAWLHKHAKPAKTAAKVVTAKASMREYPAGPKTGFYHDIAVTERHAWMADYFGNVMVRIDATSGAVKTWQLPVKVAPGKPAGAHQIDTTRDGAVWTTFTKSEQVIRFDPATEEFRVFEGFMPGGNVQYFVVDADRFMYQDKGGGIWMTHFSKEILSRLDPKTGEVKPFRTPRTEHLLEKGVHLYAAVADSADRLWYTETHGNRVGMLDPNDPAAGFEQDLPEKWVGPKRLAIDKDDVLWIPELATGKISVYDTRKRAFTDRLTLPIAGDFPYGMRRNRFTGDLWICGSGSDALYRLDPKTKQFEVFRLPRAGAYTRTVAFAPNGDVWTNYASFPNKHTASPFDAGVALRIRLAK